MATPGAALAEAHRIAWEDPGLDWFAPSRQTVVALGAAVSVPVGLHLAEAGVPAVLAQNGSYSVRSFKGFLMPFFQELIHSGQADRAAAIARREVAERRDWWMPALLLRVRNGRLW